MSREKRTPYLDRQSRITAELQRLARSGRRSITYGEFGALVDVQPRGPWKAILDHVCAAEAAEGRPDITILIVARATGLPGQIGGKKTDPKSDRQRALYDQTVDAVINYYAKGTP